MAAADEVLATLKNESKKESEKRTEILSLLGHMHDEQYGILLNLTKKITDYYSESDFKDYDEAVGVTVQYDEGSGDEKSVGMIEESSESSGDELEHQTIHGHTQQTDETRSESINPWDIDAYWLQREINKFYNDAEFSHKKSKEVLEILKTATDDRDVENRLMLLLGPDKFSIVKCLRANRDVVLYCTLLSSAQDEEERSMIEEDMRAVPELAEILARYLEGSDMVKTRESKFQSITEIDMDKKNESEFHVVDIETLSFKEGSHLMSNKKCHLPEGSYRKQRKGYEEVFVPAPKNLPLEENETLRAISSLPSFVASAFSSYQTLNRIQSKIVDKALYSDDNMLICAPTGSGKTNAALLCILRELGKFLDSGQQLDDLKVIYVAPMKSLVQEMVQNFTKRLADYGIKVAEMTGDHQLNRDQIDQTHIIVCTPEKWDIVTRKSGENIFVRLVKLVIIDEIHLLHDSRGPVLESLVARIERECITSQHKVRIVGLSATLPNYQDVASFIRVDLESGLFYFDAAYRPVPLEQQFIGITEKKPLKTIKIMNDIVYEKLIENAGRSQVLVFVHSRKETAKTARCVRDMCLEKETLALFVREGTASHEILKSEADQCKNPELKELIQFGFAIHHAGMNKIDRKLVEDLFADGHIQVLFSTATLAWGVNLPAHTVIIKGTQIYDPEKGKWVELGALDVLQMLGRAGRPQYDSKGQGILITSHQELQYYLSLMNQQLPIESQLISKLPEHLNAEIALGTVSSVEEGAEWLTYTYLFIRMLKNPTLYGVSVEEFEADNTLLDRRISLIHSAAIGLDKTGLVKYDRSSGKLVSTDLGRISSHFYCTQETINTYNRLLTPSISQIELFRTVSLSSEFKYLTVRAEEKIELQQLLEKVPIPIKESIEDPAAKINVLLQSYISQLKLDGFVLMSDMIYITQSAGRLVRAIFEICHNRGWAESTEKALALSKMIDKRMWASMCPLRQFAKIPPEIVRKIEKKDFHWERFFDLEPHEVGEVIHAPKMGKVLHKFIHHIPKLELSAHAHPITRSLLRIELSLIPDFKWDETIHGNAEAFWVFVTDVDNERILHSEYFILNHRYAEEEHYFKFYVPIFDPVQPHYYVKVISDKWVRSEIVLPISLMSMILPDKNPPPTELLDLHLLPLSSLKNQAFEAIYNSRFSYFNPIQTQVFNALYKSNDNILIGAPPGSGKSVCAELAVLSFLNNGEGKCICLMSSQTYAEYTYKIYKKTFGEALGVDVGLLTGESAADIKIVNQSTIVITSPENWDMFSRRWKQRKVIQLIRMFVVDDIHMIGGLNGPCIEVVCSRMRYISSQLNNPIRLVAISMSLANSRDMAQWLGIDLNNVFNFHPSVRPLPMTLHIQGWNINNPITRITAMLRAIHQSLMQLEASQTALIFVETRKQAKLVALDICTALSMADEEQIQANIDQIKPYISYIREKEIHETLCLGVGYLHEGMSELEQQTMIDLYTSGLIRILLVTRNMCWTLGVMAYMVIVMDTQYYDGRYHAYIDYPISDILKMISRAARPNCDRGGLVKIFCLSSKKEQYLRFLRDSITVESHLDHYLHDHFCAEVVTKVIENKQEAVDYLTWTFLYRRLTQNPSYYNMQGITHRHLSDYLSELVETTLTDLATSKCIVIEDETSVFPLNSAMIASYYYINYATIELYNASLTSKTKLRPLIEIISSSHEFENVSVRQNEEVYLKHLVGQVTYKPKDGKFTEAHIKANLLIQAYLSRINLPPEFQVDCDFIIGKCHKLAQACVDVLSSNGWLQPAIVAMEFAQMITQAVWSRDSPLKQIPYFTTEIVERCQKNKIESIFDLLDMEDEPRRKLLNLTEQQLAKVAEFCNAFPSIDVKYEISNEGFVTSGDSVGITIQLERDEEISKPVISPFFPYDRDEGIWVVIGDTKNGSLFSIKRVSLLKTSNIRLEFTAPEEAGQHDLTLYVISDSYMGSDQEFQFALHVNPSNNRKRKAENDSDEEAKQKRET
ncbi:U5 small nuclear ribonucleoprotein helicase [Thelohanellus kitauei]|uniref:U5 small nuclear ribonucleoprotein 200 kDa helicase n=1 Tax=Thelohanellus kitauei TaxID=669202 RepID=A0A0C2MTF3_THEKT|nr:U5 small nuclear ribonucleoprotein helicase [Thelohanellus kitauei]